jgi:hypothetical protein
MRDARECAQNLAEIIRPKEARLLVCLTIVEADGSNGGDDGWFGRGITSPPASFTTKAAPVSSIDQGGGKRRREGIELDQCSAR